MKRKILALMLSLTMVLTLAACGNEVQEVNGTVEDESNVVASAEDSNEAPTEIPSEVSTEAPAKTPTEEPTAEPTEEPTPEPTPEVHEHVYGEGVVTTEATCNNVGTITYNCECGEAKYDDIPMLSHEYGEYTYNNDATYEANGTESATCKLCGVVDTRTKEGTMLVKEPEPVVVPSGLDTTIGSDLAASGNTITSYNGTSIATLNKFNNAGLYNPPSDYVYSYDWFGYIDENGNSVSDPSVKNVVNNLTNIENACSFQQGYTVWNDTVYMHFVTGGAAGALELRRHPSNGYYTITINYDIASGVGSEISVEDGRDALLGLCAMISSTPGELESAIYNSLYGEVEPIGRDTWTSIGDCYAMTDMSSTWENHYVFRVKP